MIVETMKDGTARRFTDLGGYPIFYITRRNSDLCPDCALEHSDPTNVLGDYDPVVASNANWEDDSLYCDECGQRIESAYAED